MQFFSDAFELLEIFDIDTELNGAQDFATFVNLSAHVMAHPDLRIRPRDVAAAIMGQAQLSPMIFWSRIKRHCRPLYEAAPETLVALGLSLDTREIVTGYSIGLAAANVVLEACRDFYVSDRETALLIAAECKKYK